MNNRIWVPDHVCGDHRGISFECVAAHDQMPHVLNPSWVLRLHVTNSDDQLLLEHWRRMSDKAMHTRKFAVWAKFDAYVMYKQEPLHLRGCYVSPIRLDSHDPKEFYVRFDVCLIMTH